MAHRPPLVLRLTLARLAVAIAAVAACSDTGTAPQHHPTLRPSYTVGEFDGQLDSNGKYILPPDLVASMTRVAPTLSDNSLASSSASYALGVPESAQMTLVALPPANLIANPSFELNAVNSSTSITAWGSASQGYFDQAWYLNSTSVSTIAGFPIRLPTDGSFAAVTSQSGAGATVLYQDVTIPAGGATLTLDLFIGNRAGAFWSPASLLYTDYPNQQFRIDVVKPSAALTDVGSGVLANLYQTRPGDQLVWSAYKPLTFSLAQFGGQAVRLRFAMVDNQYFFNVGLDHLSLTANNQAPVVDAGGPYTGNEDRIVTLTWSATDPDGDALSYTWDFGDGSTGTGAALPASHRYVDNGTYTLRITANDGKGLADGKQTTATIANVAPTASLPTPASVSEGTPVSLSLTNATDVSTADVAAGLRYAFDCGSGYGAGTSYATAGTSTTASCPTTDNGTFTVKGKVFDKDGGASEYTATATVTNLAPSATFGNNGPINEANAVTLSLTHPTDVLADLASLRYAFDCGSGYSGGTPTYATAGTSASVICPAVADNGTVLVGATVLDKDGGMSAYTAAVTVKNVPPTFGALTLPSAPVALGTLVSVSAPFTDPGALDSHTGQVQWDNTLNYPFAAATVGGTNTAGTVTASSTALLAGVYSVTLKVTDKDGAADQKSSAPEYVVVYDPTGSFVTGGGWILSSAGDCTLTLGCQGASGKASFGFVSKYQKGATKPSGETQFEFAGAGLAFVSTSYDWLVVAGAQAQFKGAGTVNGVAGYSFLLTAVDGAVNSTGVDKFRIKIVRNADSEVVYDNQRGQTDDSEAATAIGGGSIVIHNK